MSTKVQNAVEETNEQVEKKSEPFNFFEMMKKLNADSHQRLQMVKENLKEANAKTSMKEMRVMAEKTKKNLMEQCNTKQQIIDKKKAVTDYEKS